jgi:putative DNA primase/helicase
MNIILTSWFSVYFKWTLVTELEYKTSTTDYVLISELYPRYKIFCNEDGYRPVGKTKFIQRLNHYKIFVHRINVGNVAYITNGNV